MDDQNSSRVMAVDWGAKRIGLAVSDPTRTIASPLAVIEHTSRVEDAVAILAAAHEKGASLIVVGVTYDLDNNLTPAGRSAMRLAEAIREKTSLEVQIWDEEGSTLEARQSRLQLGLSKSKRKGHFDHIAAAIFLQKYLDETQ